MHFAKVPSRGASWCRLPHCVPTAPCLLAALHVPSGLGEQAFCCFDSVPLALETVSISTLLVAVGELACTHPRACFVFLLGSVSSSDSRALSLKGLSPSLPGTPVRHIDVSVHLLTLEFSFCL